MATTSEVSNLSQLNTFTSNPSAVILIDFHAQWCGPCKAIAPVFNKLAQQYQGRVTFLKVDVDKAPDVAQKYKVQAMPTFLMLKGSNVLETLRGANPAGLEALVRKHAPAAGAAASGSGSGSGSGQTEKGLEGFNSLNTAIDHSQISCLNEASSHTLREMVRGGGDKWLESDADEQLLLHIPMQAARVRALRFKVVDSKKDQAPKTVKFFVNKASLGFDDAEALEAAQEVTLTEKQVSGEEAVQTRYVRFQNTTHLSIFVSDNQGGGDVTRIDSLEIIGTLVDGTDMSQLSKGEDNDY